MRVSLCRKTVVLAVAGSVLSGCWLQPAFDAGRTNWIPGEAALTPATVGEMVELWETDLSPGVNAPIAVGHSLYASTSSGSAASLDAATGDVRWRRDDLELGPRDPAYFDGRILVPTTDLFPYRLAMYELSSSTGEGGPTGQGGSVAVANGALATTGVSVGSGAGAIWWVTWTYGPVVLDLGFGNPRRAISRSSPIESNGRRAPSLWASARRARPYPPPADMFRCAPDWRTDLGGWPTLPAALGADGVVYADDSGTVTALDVVTGAIRWQTELGTAVYAAPAVADGTVLVATSGGRLVALDAGGAQLWEASLGASPSRAPVVGGEVVYVATTNGEIAVFDLAGCGAAACAPLTTVTIGSAVTGGPIVHDGRVIAGTQDGRVVAFGLADCRSAGPLDPAARDLRL